MIVHVTREAPDGTQRQSVIAATSPASALHYLSGYGKHLAGEVITNTIAGTATAVILQPLADGSTRRDVCTARHKES